eukprot:2045472-Pleurochrysis_carterae.AAC.2
MSLPSLWRSALMEKLSLPMDTTLPSLQTRCALDPGASLVCMSCWAARRAALTGAGSDAQTERLTKRSHAPAPAAWAGGVMVASVSSMCSHRAS